MHPKDQEEKLNAQYYENIFKQVDEWAAKNMGKQQWEAELKKHREVFLKKYPYYKQFEDSIFLDSFVENDYKEMKAGALGLIKFEEWRDNIR